MVQLSRALSYLSLQLVAVGYFCMEPKHVGANVLIAGKDDNGFILLFDWVGTPGQSPARSELPAELRFLKLPVRLILVSPANEADVGRAKLTVAMDEDLLALMPPTKAGEFGIFMQKVAVPMS